MLVCAATCLSAACGGSSSTGASDGGTRAERDTGPQDAARIDAGPFDAGAPFDAGGDSSDAGRAATDAGGAPSDAGPPITRMDVPPYVPTPSCGAATPAHTYYVDFAAGDDASPGTMAAPWKHAPQDPAGPARVLVPGDVVQFRAGVRYAGQIVLETSGADAACIVYRGTGWGDGRAELGGEGANGKAFSWGRSAPDFIRIEGFDIRDIHVSGHGAIELERDGIAHVQIVDNVIHEIYGERPAFQGKAIYITNDASDVLVEGNFLYDTEFSSLVIPAAHDVRVRGNEITAPRSAADAERSLDGCDGIIADVKGLFLIEANHIHHLLSPCHSDGMQVLGFENLQILRNRLGQAGTNAIRIEPYSETHGMNPAGDLLIANNVIVSGDRTVSQAISVSHWSNDVRSVRVLHNTIANSDFGAGCFSHGDRFASMGFHHYVGAMELANNVCFNGIAGYDQSLVTGTFSSDYNVFYNDARTWVLNLKSLDRFRMDPANAGLETHSVSLTMAEATAAFVDYPREDMHLQAGSRLVDLGVAVSGVTVDLEGASRPAGTAPDVGAYERH